MYVKQYFYNIQCDCCKALANEDLWRVDEEGAKEDADESGWYTLGGKHYCPNCVKIADDIKKSDGFNKRDYLFQGEVNDQDFYVNAQTLINISRKRLCTCASPETRYAWQIVKDAIAEIDPEMSDVMVRQCVYRGRCPERTRCGYDLTEAHHKEVDEYWKLIGR